MLHINIKTVPDKKQRYNTVGDYLEYKNGKLVIYVSDMQNWRYEMLVAIHELVEKSLCKARGICDSEITAFDKQYEKQRRRGISDEPGDDPSAPYHREHRFATKIEKLVAKELGINWEEYGNLVTKLDN